MNRIALLIGSLATLSAGTASAQTSVSLSLGYGAPESYLEGSVLVGRPYPRPLYRPYYYDRFHRYRVYRYYAYPPVILVEPRRFHRSHEWKRWKRDRERFERDFDRDRRRFDRERFREDDDE